MLCESWYCTVFNVFVCLSVSTSQIVVRKTCLVVSTTIIINAGLWLFWQMFVRGLSHKMQGPVASGLVCNAQPDSAILVHSISACAQLFLKE